MFGRRAIKLARVAPNVAALGGTPAPVPITRMVAEGDSITYDPVTPVDDRVGSYARAFAAENPSITVTNLAVTSAGIGNSANPAGTNSLWGRKADTIAANPQWLTIYIGSNDLSNATTWDGSGPASTDWVTQLYAYIAFIRANVPGVKVAVGGLMVNDPVRWASHPDFNTRRLTVNAVLRAAVGNQIDAYIPFGDTLAPSYALPGENLYDGLHPGGEGRRHMGRVYNAVMNPIIAGATGNTPSAFTLQAQTNVAPGASVRASMVVTGMGVGQTCTVSGSGLTFRRDFGSFGSGPLTVMNGDIVEVEAIASVTAGAEITPTLNVGGVTATFSVTTAVATNVEFEHSTDFRLTRTSGTGSSSTFTLVTFPAGRPMVAVKTTYQDETSVTINGVAATRIGTATDQLAVDHTLWIGPPTQSLTAGQQVTVVVDQAIFNSTKIFPAAVRNCYQLAFLMNYRTSANFYKQQPYQLMPPALTIENGGAVLFAHYGVDSTFVKFLNGSTIYSAVDGTNALRWGRTTVSGVLAPHVTVNNNATLAVEFKQQNQIADAAAPVITGGGTTSSSNSSPVAINFTTDEPAYFFLSGTDAASLELSSFGPGTSTTVRLTGNANANLSVKASYAFTLTAIDLAGNVSTVATTHTILPGAGESVWATANGVNKNQYLTLSNGNLTAEGNANVGSICGLRNPTATSGKRHFEVRIDQITSAIHIGVTNDSLALGSAVFPLIGASSNTGAAVRIVAAGTFIISRNGSLTTSATLPHGNVANGDIIAVEFDTAANTVAFYQVRSGTALQIGTTQTLTSLIPSVWCAYAGVIPTATTPRDKFTGNFGGSAWAMTPSSGFLNYT